MITSIQAVNQLAAEAFAGGFISASILGLTMYMVGRELSIRSTDKKSHVMDPWHPGTGKIVVKKTIRRAKFKDINPYYRRLAGEEV